MLTDAVPTIPADAADWIRTVVLPASWRANTRDPARCPCQGSVSGHCRAGQCMLCPRTYGWHRHGQPDPETYITNTRGMIAAVYGVPAAVWRAGRACRWLCPCRCHEQVMALFPPPRQPGRSSTTGGSGYLRIASTDYCRRDDDPQPTLWESEEPR